MGVVIVPEKATKLTTNFSIKKLVTSKDGDLPLWKECIAGVHVLCNAYDKDWKLIECLFFYYMHI